LSRRVWFEAFLYAINIPMPKTALFLKIERRAVQLLLVYGIDRADFARSPALKSPLKNLGFLNGSLAHSIERTFKITISLGNSRRGKPYILQWAGLGGELRSYDF
jgi:hypothetical protein